MINETYLRLAMDKAREGVAEGGTPFGACIVRDTQIVAVAHNQVWQDIDSTAHAEITAIRAACRALNSVSLAGCTIYSTTEPCPMCFSAIHWAGIGHIVYGTGIADAKAFGFNELEIANTTLKELSGSPITITAGVLAAENRALFAFWAAQTNHRSY